MFTPTIAVWSALLCAGPTAPAANAAAPAVARDKTTGSARRQQLQAVRNELAQGLARVQKRMDELPQVAEPLKQVEAAFKAQIAEVDKQISESDTTAASTGVPPGPQTPAAASGKPAAAARSGSNVTFTVDNRSGFSRQSIIVSSDGNSNLLVERDTERFISATTFVVERPLVRNSTVTVVVPYINQTLRVSGLGQSRTRRANGIGDVSVLFEQRFPEIAEGTELTLAAGMQLPTGKDPYHLGARDLPTGLGHYQPTFQATLYKLLVPIQVFGRAEYSTAFSRRVAGHTVRLPDSYGGQFGFAYNIGPQLATQTSVSLRKVSSPLLLGPGATVGYFSQSLTYRAGPTTNYSGSVDIGLTRDSIDFLLGLAVRSRF